MILTSSPVIILHGGGYVVGSAAMIPSPQINYLCEQNCLLVIPNYRLAPQVDALHGAYADTDSAYTWTLETLPSQLKQSHGVLIDTTRVAALGHSSGGTLALHLASRGSSSIKAVAALYPSLYNSDTTTTIHKPYTKPPFGSMPDFTPSDADWAAIAPSTHQISEAQLAAPGTPPAPRNRWQFSLLKSGTLMQTVQPDGNFTAIDPTARFGEVGANWPPTVFCLLYTSPSPRDRTRSRMPSSA